MSDYKNKIIKRRKRLFLGSLFFIFVLLTIALFVYIFIIKRVGSNYDIYYGNFTSYKNVHVSMPVTINDITVGRVLKTELTKDNFIMATIDIKKEYTNRIRKDTVLVANINYISRRVDNLKLYPGTNLIIKSGSFIETSDSKRGKILRDDYEKRENIPVNVARMFLESKIFFQNVVYEDKLNEDIKMLYRKLSKIDEDLKSGKLKFVTSKEDRIFLQNTINDIKVTLDALQSQIEAVTLIAKLIPLEYDTKVFEDTLQFIGISTTTIENIARTLPIAFEVIVGLEKTVEDIKSFLVSIEHIYEY